ncbi:hypothetical protein CLU79DRAFT_748117 [Phycomyces nitens]|nr:hypothetical protein CLU79DRAFT_748117 [Phycomyces nitens]
MYILWLSLTWIFIIRGNDMLLFSIRDIKYPNLISKEGLLHFVNTAQPPPSLSSSPNPLVEGFWECGFGKFKLYGF